MMDNFKTADDVFRFLDTFHNMERGLPPPTFRLDRVFALAALAGNPHRDIPALHIAGSKGKGSTSAMLSSILAAGGKRTGLYVSPHVEDYRERITIAGHYLEEASYIAAGEELRNVVRGIQPGSLPGGEAPTFFELLTIMAFIAYRNEGCDAMVIETGMGGRLDATNILDPIASVLTPIELEHTEYLGDTLPLIAAEKAGIIKANRPVFSSRQSVEALTVFRSAAAARSAPLYYLPEETAELSTSIARDSTELRVTFKDQVAFSRPLACRLALVGSVQGENAALAALCARRCFPELEDKTIETGLASAHIPARFERVSDLPPIILDGAHTPNSVALTLRTFRDLYGDGGVLLFSCATGKDVHGMADLLAPHFSRIIVTRPGTYRKSDSDAIWRAFLAKADGVVHEADTAAALEKARKAASDTSLPLLVIGSFYLAAVVKELLAGS